MSSPVFTLSVPVDGPYRDLAGEVVGKYLELSGRTGTDDAAFVASIHDAFGRIAPAGEDVELAVTTGADGVEVRLACHGRTATVRQTSAAGDR